MRVRLLKKLRRSGAGCIYHRKAKKFVIFNAKQSNKAITSYSHIALMHWLFEAGLKRIGEKQVKRVIKIASTNAAIAAKKYFFNGNI